MKFKSNLGVFVCPHIFQDSRPILLVIHDEGDWQCLCGEDDHDEKGHLVGMGHLTDRDSSINELVDLPNGFEAGRDSVSSDWVRLKCQPY
jgi:hypothetical protein